MGKLLITADFLVSFCKMLPKDSIDITKSPFIMNSWYNSQATLHPFVTYYLDLREIHHVNYVVISDCFCHC